MILWGTVWLATGAFAFVVNLHVHFQRVSGRLGSVVMGSTQRQMQKMGGPWPLFWTIVLVSFLLPPVALICCYLGYRRDWQAFRLEDDTP